MKVWYGYEVIGLKNIPDTGPVLIVFYHAPLPFDMIFLASHLHYIRKRTIWSVGDRISKTFPLGENMLSFSNIATDGFEQCERLLLNGECLQVAPGGVYEMLFSDDTYKIVWNDRLGFAKLALKTNTKIIPVFTKNCREAWAPVNTFEGFWKKLYRKTRWPLKLFYGGLPVKLVTVLGEPISVSDYKTPVEVRDRVRKEIEGLIAIHQRLPNNMLKALLDRF